MVVSVRTKVADTTSGLERNGDKFSSTLGQHPLADAGSLEQLEHFPKLV